MKRVTALLAVLGALFGHAAVLVFAIQSPESTTAGVLAIVAGLLLVDAFILTCPVWPWWKG